ncbi:MAG: hypothetical protein O2800_07975 [Planctomycetota bacterium]|nr:hypothetical protein [Planctomycetota bacterium]
MGGPTFKVKETGVGIRQIKNAIGLLLLPETPIVTKKERVVASAFDVESSLERVTRYWNIPKLASANELCEFLQDTPEDLSLVEQLPMIVPATCVRLTQLHFDEVLNPKEGQGEINPCRLLPVVARCTSAAFIRSQSPSYTPAILSRVVTLHVPLSWIQKRETP